MASVDILWSRVGADPEDQGDRGQRSKVTENHQTTKAIYYSTEPMDHSPSLDLCYIQTLSQGKE